MTSPDDLDDLTEDEDPEDYLRRIFEELDTLQAKVDLKIAKLYRRHQWIFATGTRPTPALRQEIKASLAAWVMIGRSAPPASDRAAIKAWGEATERTHGRREMRRLARLQDYFKDETMALWHVTEMALSSPYVPYLRRALNLPAYETPQVYLEQLELHFMGLFSAVGDELNAPPEEEIP